MHFSKRKVLAAAAALCFALLCVGAISASAVPNGDVASSQAQRKSTKTRLTRRRPIKIRIHRSLRISRRCWREKRQAAATCSPATASADDLRARAPRRSKSRVRRSAAAAASALLPPLTPDQNPQKTSLLVRAGVCERGSRSDGEMVHAGAAGERARHDNGWNRLVSGLTSTGFPVPDVMNAHQSRNYYIPNPVPELAELFRCE